MPDFNPFSDEGKAWLDYNSEEDEFGALENLGHGRTRVHSTPRIRKKKSQEVKSYVKEKGTDEQGDYVVLGGKRKRRSRKRRGGTTTPKKNSSSGNSAVAPAGDKPSVQPVAEVDANNGPQKVPVRRNKSASKNPYRLGIAKRGGKRRKSRRKSKRRKSKRRKSKRRKSRRKSKRR